MKPGYKSTEFWLTLGANLLPIVSGGLDPGMQAKLSIASAAVYNLARMVQKTAAEWKAAR